MHAKSGPSPFRTIAAAEGFFEEVEHTADLALRCGGPDLPSLFRAAARGMYRLMGTGGEEHPEGQRQVLSLQAPDVETLLVDWLGELAYLAETRGRVFREMTFASLTTTRLEAVLSGGRVARLETVIKAVTYHDLRVTHTGQGYTATVVFDV